MTTWPANLEIVVPAGLERTFEEIGEPVTDPDASPPPPDPERLLQPSERYGVKFELPDRPAGDETLRRTS
jgi:hypothetical protein